MRYALRSLLRSPGFALAVILTLALGIGANTAVFSVLRGVLLRPLPNREGDRLVYLRQSAERAGLENVAFSVPEIIDEGLTGFICDDIDEMVDAVRWLEVFDRAQCRRVFEQRFSAARMAEDYLSVYEGLIDEYGRRRDHSGSGPALHPGDLAAS